MWQSENCDVCANILYWRIYYMDKYIFDKGNGLWYEMQGDYYIPCLILSEETQPIGLWGQRHRQYLKEHRHIVYTTMPIEGTLNRYLADINQQAEQMFHRLIEEMARKQGVTEQLKIERPMEWIVFLIFLKKVFLSYFIKNNKQIYTIQFTGIFHIY